MILPLIYQFPIPGLSEGTTLIFLTLVAPMNPYPSSWVEMALQGQALVMMAYMDNKEVMLIVNTPEILSHITSEGVRRAMELYNGHLWLLTVLQSLMNIPVPNIPFFYLPTCKTSLSLTAQPQMPFQQTIPITPPRFPVFHNFMDIALLYCHWQMQGINMREVPMPTSPTGPLQTTTTPISNNITSSS